LRLWRCWRRRRFWILEDLNSALPVRGEQRQGFAAARGRKRFRAASVFRRAAGRGWRDEVGQNGPDLGVSAGDLTWSDRTVEIFAISSNCLCAFAQHGCSSTESSVSSRAVQSWREVGLAGRNFQPDAPQSLDQNAHGAVGNFTILFSANAADLVQIIRAGFGHVGIDCAARRRRAGRRPRDRPRA